MLYAQVVVAQRTRAQELTYSIPVEIVPYIGLGSLVKVPLRRQLVQGVVVGLRRTAPKDIREKLRTIHSIDRKEKVTPQRLACIRALAEHYGASLAEVAYHALAIRESAKLGATGNIPLPVFVQAPWRKRKSYYAKLLSDGVKTLMLFAQTRYARDFASFFTGSHVIVGTIGDAFTDLPAGGRIIVDQPYHIGGKSSRRPLMTNRTIARIRAKNEGYQLVYGSELLSVAQANEVVRGSLKLHSLLPDQAEWNIRTTEPGGLLHTQTVERIATDRAAGRGVVIIVASKNWAGAAFCTTCQTVQLCPNCQFPLAVRSKDLLQCSRCCYDRPLSKNCLDCHKNTVVALGVGAGNIVEFLKGKFPDVNVRTLEENATAVPADAEIVIGTERLLSFPEFLSSSTYLVGFDRLLSGAVAGSQWQLLQMIIEVQQRSERVHVETLFPDHVIWGAVTAQKLRQFFAAELQERKAYRLPPFGSMLAVLGAGSSSRIRREWAELESNIAQYDQFLIAPPRISGTSKTTSIAVELFTTRPIGATQKQQLLKLLPPSWALDVDYLPL